MNSQSASPVEHAECNHYLSLVGLLAQWKSLVPLLNCHNQWSNMPLRCFSRIARRRSPIMSIRPKQRRALPDHSQPCPPDKRGDSLYRLSTPVLLPALGPIRVGAPCPGWHCCIPTSHLAQAINQHSQRTQSRLTTGVPDRYPVLCWILVVSHLQYEAHHKPAETAPH